jgi:thymidine kinase
MNRAKYADQTTILFKYARDKRYDDDPNIASSHDGIKMTAIPVITLVDMPIPEQDVIGIDEGQFIEGVVEFVNRAAEAGKRVFVAALDSMFNRRPFERTVALLPLVENVLKLHAICARCKQDASFTKRIDSSNQNDEDIGGADKYVASCRKCFDAQSDHVEWQLLVF